MTFRQMVAKLRRCAPPLLPVRVYVRDSVGGGKCLGRASLIVDRKDRPLRFMVEVQRSSLSMMRETLMHEWAHTLTWAEGEHVGTDHSDPWAIAYGRCYRIVVEP